jgi:hypothetical protein
MDRDVPDVHTAGSAVGSADVHGAAGLLAGAVEVGCSVVAEREVAVQSSVSDEHRVRAVVLGLNVEGYDRVETALEALEHPLLDEAVGLLGSPLAGDIQGAGDVAGPHDAILGQLP